LVLGFSLLILSGCGKKVEEEKPYQIMIKTTEKMTIVYLEHVGPYDQMGELFVKLGEYGAQKQLTGQILGIYYDDPQVVPAANLRSELGMVVAEGFEPDSGYKVKELPAQKVTYTVLKGPYAEIANEYPYIFKWIEEKGHKPAGPTREIYLKAGPDVPADQLVTEVQIPIAE
jgi:AraC family transcriptional regulator